MSYALNHMLRANNREAVLGILKKDAAWHREHKGKPHRHRHCNSPHQCSAFGVNAARLFRLWIQEKDSDEDYPLQWHDTFLGENALEAILFTPSIGIKDKMALLRVVRNYASKEQFWSMMTYDTILECESESCRIFLFESCYEKPTGPYLKLAFFQIILQQSFEKSHFRMLRALASSGLWTYFTSSDLGRGKENLFWIALNTSYRIPDPVGVMRTLCEINPDYMEEKSVRGSFAELLMYWSLDHNFNLCKNRNNYIMLKYLVTDCGLSIFNIPNKKRRKGFSRLVVYALQYVRNLRTEMFSNGFISPVLQSIVVQYLVHPVLYYMNCKKLKC